MQSYTEIPSSQSLQSSLALLLSNDKTVMSNSSGSAFPTTNLQVGMTCFRVDQDKLYILKDATPTWSLIWDFNAPAVTQGADIGGGVDLNTMTATGWYHQNTNANASGGTNYPTPLAGLLKVHTDGAMTYQQYQTYGGSTELYFRSCFSGTWGAWRKVITLDNDGAGSGLDADLLDGLQSGNASDNIPINNGVVNTNLNADMVDGKHVGNASGNVPLSNGVVNTNLNADTVDGYHASAFVRTIQGVAPDASGNVTVDLASKVSKTGDTMSGNLTVSDGAGAVVIGKTGDIASYRSGGLTGYHFFNSAQNRYVGFNGTNYEMPGANLVVNGGTVWHTGNIGTPFNDVTNTSTGIGTEASYTILKSGSLITLKRTLAASNCFGTCFPKETLVTMADGSQKQISEVVVGDSVVGSSGFPTLVLGLWRPKLGDRTLFEVDSLVKTTGDHLFLTPNGWAAIDTALYFDRRFDKKINVDGLGEIVNGAIVKPLRLEIGTLALRLNEQPRPIKSIEKVAAKSTLQLYALVTADGSFVVNGGFVVDGLPQESKQ